MKHVSRWRSGLLALALVASAPSAAFAVSREEAQQAIVRADAAISLLQRSGDVEAARVSFQEANARLAEARAALEQSNNRTVAQRRAEEAELQAQVAAAQIRLADTERRAGDMDAAILVLERELNLGSGGL